MFCRHCGKQVNDTDLFCCSCGGSLRAETPQQQSLKETSPPTTQQAPSQEAFTPPFMRLQPTPMLRLLNRIRNSHTHRPSIPIIHQAPILKNPRKRRSHP